GCRIPQELAGSCRILQSPTDPCLDGPGSVDWWRCADASCRRGIGTSRSCRRPRGPPNVYAYADSSSPAVLRIHELPPNADLVGEPAAQPRGGACGGARGKRGGGEGRCWAPAGGQRPRRLAPRARQILGGLARGEVPAAPVREEQQVVPHGLLSSSAHGHLALQRLGERGGSDSGQRWAADGPPDGPLVPLRSREALRWQRGDCSGAPALVAELRGLRRLPGHAVGGPGVDEREGRVRLEGAPRCLEPSPGGLLRLRRAADGAAAHPAAVAARRAVLGVPHGILHGRQRRLWALDGALRVVEVRRVDCRRIPFSWSSV
ncbi:unnamed protein product, partial [Prorocentrum cordatum]